jgi:hypothetical protein
MKKKKNDYQKKKNKTKLNFTQINNNNSFILQLIYFKNSKIIQNFKHKKKIKRNNYFIHIIFFIQYFKYNF